MTSRRRIKFLSLLLIIGACVLMGLTRAQAVNPEEISSSVENLSSTDEAARQDAINTLIAAGKDAVEPLITVLGQKKSSVATLSSITVLAQCRDPRAVAPLGKLVTTGSVDIRRAAIQALGQIGDPAALEPLTVAASDRDPIVREYTAWALGELKEPKGAKPLLALLDDIDSSVRITAVKSISLLRETTATPKLIMMLEEHDHGLLKLTVIQSLGQLRDPRAIDPLFTVVMQGSDIESKQASIALAMIGAPVIPHFSKRLDEPTCNIMRFTELLAQFGETLAVSLLPRLASPDIMVRRRAVSLLGGCRTPKVGEALIAMLKDPDSGVRNNAVVALGMVYVEQSIRPLIDVLSDEDPSVRREAAASLAWMTRKDFGTDQNRWLTWWKTQHP